MFPSFADIKLLAPKAIGGEGLFSTAYGLTGKRLLGTMTEADKDLYRRLLKADVVGTQIEARQQKELLDDVFNAETSENRVMNKLLNVNKKLKTVSIYQPDKYSIRDTELDFFEKYSLGLVEVYFPVTYKKTIFYSTKLKK